MTLKPKKCAFSAAKATDTLALYFSEASDARMDAKNGFSIKFYIDLDIRKKL